MRDQLKLSYEGEKTGAGAEGRSSLERASFATHVVRIPICHFAAFQLVINPNGLLAFNCRERLKRSRRQILLLQGSR